LGSEKPRRNEAGFVNTPLRRRLKEELLRRILGGHYDPGERLVELRIAEEFGTSQGPVREALRELEATGLVTNIPRRGTYVSEVMGEGLREIYTVRGALEEQATRIVTARRLADLSSLQREVDGMRDAALAGETDGVVDHSVRFHRAIMQAAGNRLLLNIWQSLQIETRTTITMLVEGLDLVEIADSHQPIIDAIASGDAETAARVAREHQDYFERLPVPVR
jgi:DNA-binding GntR family transcriptional regulator